MQTFIVNYGYLAIFVLMLAESACIPVPSELTMLFGGALAGGAVAGAHLDLALVVAAGVAGNVAGSYLAWGVGRYGGRAAWRRWGRYILLRDEDIDRAERWFNRHGTKAVFFGRLLPVIRTFISLPAGFASMPPVRFGIYTVAGCIPWTLGLAWAGYAVGSNWQSVAAAFHGPTYALAAIVGALAVLALAVLGRRRRESRETAAARDRATTDARPDTGPCTSQREEGTMDADQARARLLDERAEVDGLLRDAESAALQDRAAEGEVGDAADAAQPLAAQGVDDAVADSLRERLAALDRALRRLDDGTYGRSVRSGQPIPDERLEADPAAELTVEEAQNPA